MLYQPILKLGRHEGECEKGFFIFNNANNLNNGQLSKIHELKKTTNNKLFVAN